MSADPRIESRADLDALLAGFGDATVDDDEVELPTVDGPDDEHGTFVAYVGLVDLVAEVALEGLTSRDREAAIARGLQRVNAAEGPVRYARNERTTTAERQELVARMRGKDILLTSEWLVPRLSGDIDAYRRRIETLERIIQERRG